MDELEADVICFANLKGSKDKELLRTAEALRYKKSLPGFGSNAKVGKYYGVSGEIVREFLALIELPKQIQALIDDGAIGLDVGARLAKAKKIYPRGLNELSKAVTGMTAMDARDVIEHVLKNPNLSIRESKRRILDAKTVVEHEYHVMVVLPEQQFTIIEKEARQRQLSVSAFISSVLGEWLQGVDA